MSDPDVEALLRRAGQACRSARSLLDAEDTEGACSRAYYAMFHAARAALVAVNSPDLGGKTHGGVIAAFGLHLVKTGKLSPDLGRSFNHVEHVRIVADYRNEVIDLADAHAIVDQADMFVEAIRAAWG